MCFLSSTWLSGSETKTFLFGIPLAVPETHQEVRGTEDPQSGTADLHLRREDTRSQDKSEPKKIFEFLHRSAGAATPTRVTWSSADNKHRVQKRNDLVSTFIKWVNNECLVFVCVCVCVCVYFLFFFSRMCSTTVSCTGYPSVQMTRRIKGYSLSSAKTPNPTNTSATCLTVKSV